MKHDLTPECAKFRVIIARGTNLERGPKAFPIFAKKIPFCKGAFYGVHTVIINSQVVIWAKPRENS
jgi:hypothetical protein